jgi:AcrR family transcriptional regulator
MSAMTIKNRSLGRVDSRRGTSAVRGGAADVAGGAVRGGVPEIQRVRIMSALVEVAREHGGGRVTVTHIVTRSGVSRRTFYELFEDRDACFLATLDHALERAAARVLPVFADARGPWRARVRAGSHALLEFLDDEPELGGMCIVDALGAGPLALERRARVVQALVDVVDAGRADAKAALKPSRLTAEGVVGGVLSVLYGRLAERAPDSRSSEPVSALLNPLMGMIVLPYLGPAAAAKEMTRVVPAVATPRSSAAHRANPLAGLGMRLTYRTMRVLSAIASEPRASNRRVAVVAGIQDPGQISKLLARLEHLELVENLGLGSARGEPNAWCLTARGREIEDAIREQIEQV